MDVNQIKALDPKRVIVLDTETTGTSPYKNDEILSLTIMNLEGTVLYNELVKPVNRKSWAKAAEINHITPAMVKDKQPITFYADYLQNLWRNIDLVVGFNVKFDTDFLYASGLNLAPHVEEFDVMKESAPLVGIWNEKYKDYKWPKLSECAAHYGIGQFEAHTSLGDTEATRQCFLAVINDPKYGAKINAGTIRKIGAGMLSGKDVADKRLRLFAILFVIAMLGAFGAGQPGQAFAYLLVAAALFAIKVFRLRK